MNTFKVPSIIKILFHTTLEVRISDINYGNHLAHDSFISLLHEARIRFLRSLGYESEANLDGLGLLLTNLYVNYVKESFYSNRITINIGVGKNSKTTIELIYQALLQDNNKEIARALTTMTFYDYKKSKVAKIPQSFLSNIGLVTTLQINK